MTCSICHEINHNANDCNSPLILNTFSTISNIFVKDLRSYFTLNLNPHPKPFQNLYGIASPKILSIPLR